jgi:2-keto-3-deoxy-L-rhamnonate aldolase RhmA
MVSAACSSNGKRWGAVTPNAAYASLMVAKGCTLVSATNDVKLVTAGMAATREDFADVW